jgi:gamma-glutamyltranspeptidase/glutathione hydrolase
MRKYVPVIWLFALVVVADLPVEAQIDRITGKNFATRSEILARHGMVCTSVPAATQAGLDILKHGGSAVDAAIAANATLVLMEFRLEWNGGDFSPSFTARKKITLGINCSGRAPSA